MCRAGVWDHGLQGPRCTLTHSLAAFMNPS